MTELSSDASNVGSGAVAGEMRSIPQRVLSHAIRRYQYIGIYVVRTSTNPGCLETYKLGIVLPRTDSSPVLWKQASLGRYYTTQPYQGSQLEIIRQSTSLADNSVRFLPVFLQGEPTLKLLLALVATAVRLESSHQFPVEYIRNRKKSPCVEKGPSTDIRARQ